MKRVVILGAGITGLALAWSLKKKYGPSLSVTLLEKSDRVGGWIRTIHNNGFLFDVGPHSCRTHGNGTATLKLIEDLGLQSQVITPDPTASRRYLYIDGKLTEVPHHLLGWITSPLAKGIPAALWRDWRTPPGPDEDESIASFGERRFGHEVTQKLIDPLITGIYAGDITQLSIKSCFPQWKHSEQAYGSVIGGMLRRKRNTHETVSEWQTQIGRFPFFSLKHGLGSLTYALEKHLQSDIIRNCVVSGIQFVSDHVAVLSANGNKWHADHLYSTIPPAAMASLLVPHRPALAILLQSITAASVAVVSLGYSQTVLKKKGFGYLIPSKEKEKVLGVIWDSSVFPQQNRHPDETRLTVMMGGTHHPNLCKESDDTLRDMALSSLKQHLEIDAQPEFVRITRASNAIPQYKVGHSHLIQRITSGLHELSPRITLLGAAFNGASVNDCIAEASNRSF